MESLVSEVKGGLASYRQQLIEHSGESFDGKIDLEQIKNVLGDLGVYSDTPLITIPDTMESLEEFHTIGEESRWFDPFTHSKIADALDKRRKYEEGASIYEVWPATALWSEILDISVVFDNIKSLEEELGFMYPRARAISTTAHEITQGAFAHLTKIDFKPKGENATAVDVEGTYGISQATDITTLAPNKGLRPDYEPLWLDQAFAEYMASEAREKIYPESIPKKPYVAFLAPFGVEEFELPPKYLISSGWDTDYPAPLAGLEGVGFDLLNEKHPWIVGALKSVISRKLSIDRFHADLKDGIGTELYSAITTHRPYSDWYNIYLQIEEN